MSITRGILICGEADDGKLSPPCQELFTVGKKLAEDAAQPLGALIIGKEASRAASEAATLGANTIFFLTGAVFAESTPESYVSFVEEAYRQFDPEVVLFSHNDMGREVAPRIAAKLKASVTLDCIQLALDADTKDLLQTKPAFGGNAIGTWLSEGTVPKIATVRPRSYQQAVPDGKRAELVELRVAAKESRARLVQTVKEEVKGIKLEDAKIIVAGGGGIGGKEGFNLLEELAKVLGGTVGVSRVPCDEDWRPLSQEIGQTGKIVSPNLYIAIGISGAPQHMAGCSGSKTIVAINRDRDARIFQEADFGVVGDYKQVVAAFTEGCK